MAERASVLVTGGAGFVGGVLARRLAGEGRTLHLVDDLRRGRRDPFLCELLDTGRVELLERDLTGRDALRDLGDQYTHVFHLAAILGVGNVLERPYETLRDNVILLERTIELARRQRNLQRLVFASTSEVYAGALEHLPMPIPTPEDVPLALPALEHPRTTYMLSKLCGEAMVHHAGLPFTILRPHNLYGPRMGMSHVVPELLAKAHRLRPGDALEVASVDHRRAFCFVDDAVEMIGRAAFEPRCAGQVLNVGNPGPEIRIGDLARLILRTVGREAAIAALPPTPGSPARRCPDVSRIVGLTGYRARIDLEDGLRRTYAWYRSMVFDADPPEIAG